MADITQTFSDKYLGQFFVLSITSTKRIAKNLLTNSGEFFFKCAAGGISVASTVVKKTKDIMMNQTRAKPRGNDRVLVIGQPDSIHTERFVGALRQRNPDIELFLYPSNPFPFRQKLSSLCDALVKHPDGTSQITGSIYYRHISFNPMSALSGKFEHLAALIQQFQPDFIHVNCIQDGGYILNQALKALPTKWNFQISLSVWGNDLFRYVGNPMHEPLIAEFLQVVDVLVPESLRDISLAKKFGFKGRTTEVVQATLTSDVLLKSFFDNTRKPKNNQILIRAADDGDRAANAVAILGLLENIDWLVDKKIIYCGSVVDEMRLLAPLWKNDSIDFEHIGVLPQDKFFRLLEDTSIFISLTLSDGLPNTFLECCASQTYPIFSTCSTVSEWLIDENLIAIDPYDKHDASKKLQQLLSGKINITAAIEQNFNLLSRYSEDHIDQVFFDLFEHYRNTNSQDLIHNCK